MFNIFALSNQMQQASSSIKKSKRNSGLSLGDRIIEARKSVEQSLGAYKDRVRAILSIEDLISYFENTKEIIAIDTETMGQFKAQLYSNI